MSDATNAAGQDGTAREKKEVGDNNPGSPARPEVDNAVDADTVEGTSPEGDPE